MSVPSRLAVKRLSKELKNIDKNLPSNIAASAQESNILEWHYVIKGEKDTPYEGGYYHGVLQFPVDYPSKPPAIRMYTPNGRFETNQRLCLSISDFHPESWSPSWTVATVIIGLHSFMLDNEHTYGSIRTSDSDKKKYAKASLEFNRKNKLFCELFPEFKYAK